MEDGLWKCGMHAETNITIVDKLWSKRYGNVECMYGNVENQHNYS